MLLATKDISRATNFMAFIVIVSTVEKFLFIFDLRSTYMTYTIIIHAILFRYAHASGNVIQHTIPHSSIYKLIRLYNSIKKPFVAGFCVNALLRNANESYLALKAGAVWPSC